MKKPEPTRSMVLASGVVEGALPPPPLPLVPPLVREPTSMLSMPRVVDPFSGKIVRM
jgi:hypothetical protein